MSPPSAKKKDKELVNGHSVRPVITTARRNEIWDNMYRVGMDSPACKNWCTRDELVQVASTKQGGLMGLTTQELTEVFRGKKHKVALGLESQRLESGDVLYRFVVPTGKSPKKLPVTPSKTKNPQKKSTATAIPVSSKKKPIPRPPAAPASARKAKPAENTPAKAKGKKVATTPASEPKRQGGSAGSAKRMTPLRPRSKLRPRPKSPQAGADSAEGIAGNTNSSAVALTMRSSTSIRPASRKRRAEDDEPSSSDGVGVLTTPLRSAITKRSRISSERRDDRSVSFKVQPGQGGGDRMGGGGGAMSGVGVGGVGGGSWCTIS